MLVGPTLDSYPGGIAVQSARLAAHFNRGSDVQIELLSIAPRLPGLLRSLQRIPVVRTLVTFVIYAAQLITRMSEADVVHVNSARFSSFVISSLPAIAIAKLLGRPTILNYRNGDLRNDLQRHPAFRGLLGWPDVIVVPSGFLQEVFAEVGLHAVAIANQVDLGRFSFRNRDPLRPIFLSCRHFEAFYDIPTLIRAFGRIQSARDDASLIIAGKGHLEPRIRELVGQLGLKQVEFIGQVDPAAMPEVYDQADILLNSSQVDNTPGSLIEALAAGLPVVSTAAGGIPFIISDDRTGRLVPVGDDVALARAALKALADPERTRAMAVAGRAEGELRYSWASVKDQWLELYRGLATRNRGAAVHGSR